MSLSLTDLNAKAGLDETYLPGLVALGQGYDIYKDYADQKSFLYQLFDFSKVTVKEVKIKSNKGTTTYKVPDIITFNDINSSSQTSLVEESLSPHSHQREQIASRKFDWVQKIHQHHQGED